MQRNQRRFVAGIAVVLAVGLVPAAAGATSPNEPVDPADSTEFVDVDTGTAVPLAESSPLALTEAGRTVTIFSGTSTAGAATYWDVGHGGPGNLVSPVNYAGGRAVLKVRVLSKPSSKRLAVQVCMWRNNFRQETCSPKGYIVNEGSYTFNLGRPAGWWKKGGFGWSQPYQITRIMVKDASTGRLMMNRRCGAACYRGNDLGQHVPIKMSGTLTFTA